MRVFYPYLLALFFGVFIFQPVTQAAQTYRISVKASPSDSIITIWNIQEKFKQGMRLKPGRYDLQVHKAGYQAQRRWINLDKNLSLRVELVPKSGNSSTTSARATYPLNLKLEPSDASVKIMNIVPTFKQGIRLASGNYQLQISHPDYKTLDKIVEIEQAPLELAIKLSPINNAVAPKLATAVEDDNISYSLFISALPPGTEIAILNIKPVFYQGMRLAPGRYHIRITSPGYDTRERWVDITDQDVYLDINLEPIARSTAEALELAYQQKQNEALVTTKKSSAVADTATPTAAVATDNSPHPVHIYTIPADAKVSLLNYEQAFNQDQLLAPGRYHLSVSKAGYPTRLRWFEVKDQALNLYITLSKSQQCFYSKTQAGSAENKTEMTRLLHLQFYGDTVQALYSTRMLPDGKANRFRLFGTQKDDVLELIGTIYYGKEPAELHSRIQLGDKQAIMAFDGQQYTLSTMDCPKN